MKTSSVAQGEWVDPDPPTSVQTPSEICANPLKSVLYIGGPMHVYCNFLPPLFWASDNATNENNSHGVSFWIQQNKDIDRIYGQQKFIRLFSSIMIRYHPTTKKSGIIRNHMQIHDELNGMNEKIKEMGLWKQFRPEGFQTTKTNHRKDKCLDRTVDITALSLG